MHSTKTRSARRARSILMGSSLLAGAAVALLTPVAALAQDDDASTDEIVVTGFRGSLQQSADAKRNSTSFIDSVFAEDIGKFPDTNIAESFNRIPGITINREITGEGLNITIRGLGTNFTRILLNGAPVAVASTGRTDAQNTNREVDLDLFPTELFTQLTVNKTSQASMLEGGAAGTVDMRSARPFDNPGEHITYSFQGTKNSNADAWGQRGSVLASKTWDNFGVLVGVAGVRNKVRVTGFETIGWTTPNFSAAQCGVGNTCNQDGGGNWTIPSTVPMNAGNGLTPGDTIDAAFLLANNPGYTTTQLSNARIPRLGRPSDEFGTKERANAIASIEFRPTDNLHFFVDSMYGRKANDLERIDMNWVGRNGAMVPLNLQLDQNNVVTSGTFANAQFFLEYRPFIEDVEYWGVNPGMEWQLTESLKFDVQANWTESDFHRESPTVLVITPASSGVTVNYTNDGSSPFPIIDSNIDFNDPSLFGWPGGRVNIQDERRHTETKGVRGNFTWGDADFNIKVGAAYDDVSRDIRAFDASQQWQNAVCGGNPNVYLESPNSQPPCQGLTAGAITPGVGGYPSYPGLGTGSSAGITTPLAYQGSLIPQGSLGNYLIPGPSGFITVDWDSFVADSNYDAIHDGAPEAGSSNTGASGGSVREKTTGAYGEVNGVLPVSDHQLRFNVGLRWVHTDQTIGGRVSIRDNRNDTAPVPADGGLYPNIVTFVETTNSYDNWLPSGNFAFDVSDDFVVRLALSRTMTRPNPNSMLPGLNFSTPSADVGNVGNPALEPYISNNIDLGFEYYTGGEGFIGAAVFRKTVKNFTQNGTATVPFSTLSAYGVTYSTLTPTQQAAIDSRCGVGNANSASCTVVLNQQVNATGLLTVNGLEFTWVQPLDFLLAKHGLEGFGFTGNLTIVDQKGTGAAPAVAVGVAPYTYNVTGYYENHGASVRISKTFAKGSVSSNPNQNGIPLASIYGDDYGQWDMSSSFNINEMFGLSIPSSPELTFDIVNLFKEDQRSYFQYENAAFTYYNPGRTFFIGFRGGF